MTDKQTSECKNMIKSDNAEKQKRLDALYEFAGSGKNIWSDMEALEYQNSLREERSIG